MRFATRVALAATFMTFAATSVENAGASQQRAQLNSDLYHAVEAGNLVRVKELIAAGANVNAETRIDTGTTETTLLNAQSVLLDPNCRGLCMKYTYGPAERWADDIPLPLAARRNDLEILRVLLAAGADVDSRDYDKWTALMFALANGNPEMLQVLIAAGADVNVKGSRNETEFEALMRQEHHPDIMLALLEPLLKAGFEPDTRDFHFNPMLFWASQNNHLEIVKVLLAAGADVDIRNNYMTPLMVAAQYGHLEIVRALLAAKADVNAEIRASWFWGPDEPVKDSGVTGLMLASRQGHLEVVRALLAAGANVNAKADNGRTALNLAMSNGHADVAQLLENSGARE